MAWQLLGVIDLSGGQGLEWQSTSLSAIDQDLIRLSFLVPSGKWDFHSALLIRRKWDVVGDIGHVEPSQYVSFSPQRVLLTMPISGSFIEAGLAIYRLEVKKRYRYFRGTISEPNVSVLIEVQ